MEATPSVALPVPRGNVGQAGEGAVHTAKIPHHLSSSNCRIASAELM